MTLDYPNKEVRQSMYQFLLNDLARNPYRTDTGRTIKDLQQALVQRNLTQVCIMLNAILADLPAEVFEKKSEGLYHGLVHIIFSYLGMFIQSEVHSSRGRADAVVETATDIFIFEFKFNRTAAEAMAQIHAKGYANKYQSSSKSITAIAFNFSTETRDINEWLEEKLKD
jgi:PD-(D/E)XK nuclease superfamily